MRKNITMLFLVILICSCSKRTSDLILEENIPQVEVMDNVATSNEVKPLIMISKEDILKIYVRADGAPGMFLNNSGVLEGFYVDLEKAIMKEMGQKYKLISYTDLGPLIQKMKSGEAHSVLATVDVPDYRALANISTTYEILPYVIFWPTNTNIEIPKNKEEGIKSVFSKKVGVQTRGHIYQLLREYKDIEIIEYPTTTVAMEALSKGEVDAVPEVLRIGAYYSKLNTWDVKPVGGSIFELNIGTGFSKALDTSIVERYNKALNSLTESGYVDYLYNNYFEK